MSRPGKSFGEGISLWVVGFVATLCIHIMLAFLPVDLSRAPAKERPPVQLFMEPQATPQELQPAPEPPEPEVEQPSLPKPKPVAKRKRVRKRKPTPKPVPEVAPPPIEEIQEVVEAVEEVVEEPVEDPVEDPKPVQVNLGPYGRGLHSSVQRKQRYPRAARMMRMEGTAEVEIRVKPDGSLASAPVLIRSSGHDLLDKEALRMVRVAAPYPELPDGFIGESALFKVPVRFSISR